MLHKSTIELLSKAVSGGVVVQAIKRDGVGNSARFIAAPASSMKRPWVVIVNEVLLMDDRCRDFRYASESAAIKAGYRYAKSIV